MEKTGRSETISVRIEVELDTLEQIEQLFGSIDNKSPIQLCDGKAELRLLAAGNTISFDGGSMATLLLSFSVSVASGVVANIIFAALCKGIKKLELNGRRTRITEKNIAQVIETTKNATMASEHEECFEKNSNAPE